MEVHRTYPEQSPRTFWRRNRKELLRSAFVITCYILVIVNLCVGGMPWALIAIGGMGVFWVAFNKRPLVEITLIKELSHIGVAVCLYLFLLDAILGQGWSDFVAPIVFFGDLVVLGFLYLAFFKKQKRNFLPLFELILTGLIAMLCGLVGLRDVNWPLIVVGSVSLGLSVLSAALFFKPIAEEFRKKFHM